MSRCDKPSGPSKNEWEKLTLTQESLGKWFSNRDGEPVKVFRYNPLDNELYPFGVRYEDRDETYCVSYYGDWYRGTRNGKDLIARLP
jgi:hypothetical protein